MTMTNIDKIAIPVSMAARPKDRRGYPIPYIQFRRPDGTVDFRINDEELRREVIYERRCAMCGKPLSALIAFIGGNASIESRLFSDPGMHPACARYAVKVCPYLLNKDYRPTTKLPALQEGEYILRDELIPATRPAVMGIVIARRYLPAVVKGADGLYVQARDIVSVEFF